MSPLPNSKDGVKKPSISRQEAKARAQMDKMIEREIVESISNHARRLQLLQSQTDDDTRPLHSTDNPDLGVRAISMAGNNNGATMNLGSHDFGIQEGKEKSMEKTFGLNQTPINTYINNNVQGVNNSILYDSSSGMRDPGVQLDLSNTATSSSVASDDPTISLDLYNRDAGNKNHCLGGDPHAFSQANNERHGKRPRSVEYCRVCSEIVGGEKEKNAAVCRREFDELESMDDYTHPEVVCSSRHAKPRKGWSFVKKLLCGFSP
eukprot:Gb_06277 [translate_table: standard]